jgi:serine/threonine-protein kinase
MSDVIGVLSSVLATRYDLGRQIGEGGMASVYLARDIRHERSVAIKVLKPELAARLGSERFVREIKVTANLQHPNILPLYDSGAAHGFLYYVMPYVEGESLRAKIDREGQLSVEEAIEVARAVAGALDYAHEHGVVHRDIKPENILLHRGQALVADFGIALAVSAAGAERITETGFTIGTAYYMSPEQAAGRPVDARSDIYSLGAVTYEMLTGDPPHRASSAHAVIAKILSEKPSSISQSRELVPANVDAAVQRALAKSPADRFKRAAHFAEALTNTAFRLPVTASANIADTPVAATRATWVWSVALATLAVGLLAGWFVHDATAPRALPSRPAVFFLATDSVAPIGEYPAVSPQGTTLVYPAGDAEAYRLYVRRLDNPVPAPLARTEGATGAFFSPNGEWVGFVSGEQALKKVRLRDGSDVVIAPYLEGMAGATWRDDDTILLATLPDGALVEVSASGGVLKPLVIGTHTFTKGFFFPHFLPGGNAVVFNTELAGGLIGVLNLQNGQTKTFGRGLRPSFIDTGHLIFAATRDGRLAIQKFDVDRLDAVESPSMLPEELNVGAGRALYAVSRGGGTLAITRRAGTELDLALYDRAGREQILFRSANYWAPRFSPDGNRIALGGGSTGDVWIYDIPTKGRHRFTREGADGNDPVWSPDGEQIVFSSMRPTPKDLHVRQTNGSRLERQLLVRDGLQWPSDWTRDGYIVFTDVLVGGDRDIWVVKADGSQPPLPYLDTDFIEKSGDVSPDGRWLAYDSNASGQVEVVVNSFPKASASPVIVSHGGGRNPRWGHDGRELFYWKERKLIAARIDWRNGPRATAHTTVLETNYAPADHANFDVHPDGTRFIVVTGRERPQRLIVAFEPLALVPPK